MTGPTSLIRQLKSPYFLKIDEEEIDSDFDEDVSIPFSRKKIMIGNPGKISVKFTVEEFIQKTLDLPIEKLNFEDKNKFVLTDSTVQVTFMVANSKEKDVTESSFNITADLSTLDNSDSTITLVPVQLSEFASDIEFAKE